MLLEIETKVDNDKGLYSLKGVLDASTVDFFIQKFDNYKKFNELVIDIRGLRFLDSSGIGGLVQIAKKHQKESTKVRIINVPNEIFEVLELLGIIEVLGQEIFSKMDS